MAELESLTYTVTEAAAVLGVSRSTAYECVRSGDLRAIRLGRRLVVPKSAITDLLCGSPSPVTGVASDDGGLGVGEASA